jgi:hypothetical protein
MWAGRDGRMQIPASEAWLKGFSWDDAPPDPAALLAPSQVTRPSPPRRCTPPAHLAALATCGSRRIAGGLQERLEVL